MSNGETIQPAIRISSNVIGIPTIETPVDQDIEIVVSKSGGHMLIPCLLIQLLREVRSIKERLDKAENTYDAEYEAERHIQRPLI